MEMRFLLDTDIFIYIRQKRPEEDNFCRTCPPDAQGW